MTPTVELLESLCPRICEIVKYSGHERLIKYNGTVYSLAPVTSKGKKTFSITPDNKKV